jgi:hypothetical protein
LVNEKIIFKEELLNIINETPNDMELGFKIRNLFNRV